MYLIPELDVGVIALINREQAVPTNSIPLALNLKELVEPYEPNLSIPSDVSAFTGEYYNDFNIGSMLVTDTESGLKIEIPTLDEAGIRYEEILTPVRPNNFHLLYPDGSFDLLSFLRDETGTVEYLRSRNYVGKKRQGQSYAPHSPSQEVNARHQFGLWESRTDVFSSHK